MENKILCTLTYSPQNAPLSTNDASKNLTKFIYRLRYYAQKHGYDPLRYTCIAEVDDEGRTTRIHHHIIMNFSKNKIVAKI